jgi:hypothetical protein
MSEQYVTIDSMRFGNRESRCLSCDRKYPTVFSLGNGMYAPVYVHASSIEGVFIITEKPRDVESTINVLEGIVLWDCVPYLVTELGEREIWPNDDGIYLLSYGQQYRFRPPDGYGERIIYLGREP